jgi:hypothetical protein
MEEKEDGESDRKWGGDSRRKKWWEEIGKRKKDKEVMRGERKSSRRKM